MDLTTIYNDARTLMDSNKMDEARDMCDLGIVKVAQHRLEGAQV